MMFLSLRCMPCYFLFCASAFLCTSLEDLLISFKHRAKTHLSLSHIYTIVHTIVLLMYNITYKFEFEYGSKLLFSHVKCVPWVVKFLEVRCMKENFWVVCYLLHNARQFFTSKLQNVILRLKYPETFVFCISIKYKYLDSKFHIYIIHYVVYYTS